MNLNPDKPVLSDIRAGLKAQREARGERLSTKLPVSGYTVTYPAFISHAQVMAATKLAGKDRAKVGPILVSQICLFEGERLTVDEITADLLHNVDAVHLINIVLGDGGRGEGEGEDVSGN